jgi:hypothetical protein
MVAEGEQFPWWWDGGTISMNLDRIWGMSVEILSMSRIISLTFVVV